jgi:dihydrolipoamide dehydrogenase
MEITMQTYDVVIIGAGPGGYEAALELGRGGKKVLLIDRAKERIGGVCLNEGCIPAKMYLESAEYAAKAVLFKERGLAVETGGLDLARLKAKKDDVVAELRGGVVWLLDQANVALMYGEALFVDAHTLEVDGERVGFEGCIIAVGSKSREVPGVLADGVRVFTSTEVFELERLPASIAIIGGGAIGCELASFFADFGVAVTLIGRRAMLVPNEDEELSKAVIREFKKRGVRLLLETAVEGATVESGGVTLKVSGEAVACEAVLLAAGRVSNTAGLDAKKAGVTLDGKGYVHVGPDFRTAQPHIFAVGDCIPTPGYAHTAYAEAKVAAHNLLTGEKKANEHLSPSALFCRPNAASCGLNEREAKAQGREVVVTKAYYKANARAKIHGGDAGFIKAVADAKTGRLLGASVVGEGATETIHELLLAIERGMSAKELREMIHVHPSLAELVLQL